MRACAFGNTHTHTHTHTQVVRDVPYVLSEEYLQEFVFGKMRCDYVVHGDDPCLDAVAFFIFPFLFFFFLPDTFWPDTLRGTTFSTEMMSALIGAVIFPFH